LVGRAGGAGGGGGSVSRVTNPFAFFPAPGGAGGRVIPGVGGFGGEGNNGIGLDGGSANNGPSTRIFRGAPIGPDFNWSTGGGGWGAAAFTDIGGGNAPPAGLGGRGIQLNGNTVTYLKVGTIWGAVS
jgi:hypothetical protein